MKRKTVPKRIKNTVYNDLYKQTNRLAQETEKRLKRLEKGIDINRGVYNPKTKRFERKNTYTIISDTGKRITIKPTKIVKYDSDSWAGKKLHEKLSTIKGMSSGSLKLPKKISIGDLKAANKAFKNFLRSKTSERKGIKEVEERIKGTIESVVEDVKPDLTSGEVETLYKFFEDKDFNYVTKFIDPSELYVMMAETANEGGDSNDFLRKIENYIYSESLYQDDDLVSSLESIYNKFVGK